MPRTAIRISEHPERLAVSGICSPEWLRTANGRVVLKFSFTFIELESYHAPMIKTFKCADTEALFNRQRVARFVNFESVARRKLEQLNQAAQLGDLRVPPGNRLEALKGARTGQHSIRVNDQFRVCFRWTGTDAEDVEIVDYH